MCLATVYVDHNGDREEVMRDVAWIEPKGQGFELVTLMGESRLFQASIKSIDLMKGSIILEGAAADWPQEESPTEGVGPQSARTDRQEGGKA